jgi:hypothetical protein
MQNSPGVLHHLKIEASDATDQQHEQTMSNL